MLTATAIQILFSPVGSCKKRPKVKEVSNTSPRSTTKKMMMPACARLRPVGLLVESLSYMYELPIAVRMRATISGTRINLNFRTNLARRPLCPFFAFSLSSLACIARMTLLTRPNNPAMADKSAFRPMAFRIAAALR